MALVIVVALTLVIFAAYKVVVDNGKGDERYGIQDPQWKNMENSGKPAKELILLRK